MELEKFFFFFSLETGTAGILVDSQTRNIAILLHRQFIGFVITNSHSGPVWSQSCNEEKSISVYSVAVL